MLPIIQRELVDRRHWLDTKQFMDCLAVAQAGPGAIAVNTAIFTGYKMMGITGVLAATAGVVLPSFLIIVAIAATLNVTTPPEPLIKFFLGIRPAVVALIAGAAFNLGRIVLLDSHCWMVAGLALLGSAIGVHPALLIAGAATYGVLRARLEGWQVKKP
jgi:chromate transporter